MTAKLVVSLLLVTLIIGIGIGFMISPSYQTMREDKKGMQMELGEADRRIDLRYYDGMIAHHLNAIYMSRQAQNSHRLEIRNLADAIITADEQGIKELYTLKKKIYNDTREVAEYEAINLGVVDDEFDLRFLNALIAHHDDAIKLAKDARTKSKQTETLTLADDVITGLTASLQTLTTWRKEWYGL